MNRKVFIIGASILCLILIVLLGYFFLNSGQKKEDLINKPSKPLYIQPKLQQEIVFPTYNYDSQKLRDPFAPLIVKREEIKKGAFPLESYDIEELKLTGIVKDKNISLALIQAPDGRFYILRENDRIGFSGGRVIRILKDRMEIKEENKKVRYLKLRTEE